MAQGPEKVQLGIIAWNIWVEPGWENREGTVRDGTGS